MTDFPDKLRLKERAEEDIYFARRDRELIEAMHRRRPVILIQVRSGGQTGVDRGALDAVLALSDRIGTGAGGWCPRGRRAEDGFIETRYPLDETPSPDPAQRTEWNVRDSDATLILTRPVLSAGTAVTERVAERLGRPLLRVDLTQQVPINELCAWLQQACVSVLNVAGPRESECPGIEAQTRELMQRLLIAVADARIHDEQPPEPSRR
ncbi:MAG: putative molybdenum carrier protein [Thiohalocapsa sp.]